MMMVFRKSKLGPWRVSEATAVEASVGINIKWHFEFVHLRKVALSGDLGSQRMSTMSSSSSSF